MHALLATRRTNLRVHFVLILLLVLGLNAPPAYADQDKPIDFSKYDKDMLLLVIDQMQKRIQSLERENQLLREKIASHTGGASSPSRQHPVQGAKPVDSANGPTDGTMATGSDRSRIRGDGQSARPAGAREIGRRGVRTEALRRFDYNPIDRSYVGTGDRTIASGTNLAVKLGVTASFQGKEPPKEPRVFTLVLTWTSAHRHFPSRAAQSGMMLILDGEEIETGIDHYQHSDSGTNVLASQRHNESLTLFIKPSLFSRIADARSVVIRTLPRTFELDAESHQALRDLNDYFAGR